MTNIEISWANDIAITEVDICENPFPENVLFVPADKTYCRHCGEAINMKDAGVHLLNCRPDIHEAIETEFELAEERAFELAAN